MTSVLLASLLVPSEAPRPQLRFEKADQAPYAAAYESALRNVLETNTVRADLKEYNATGLMRGERFLRAGRGYDQPWTRDASINSWNAASLLEPNVARDTLWSVTRLDADGKPIVQRDNQWWDKVVWIVGAWSHYRVTGDQAFLQTAYGVSERLLREMRREHYEEKVGLFEGPSFFNDGIAGYPAPPAEKDDGGSSFVLDHPGTAHLKPLSTNSLYVGAYRAMAGMAKALGQPTSEWTKDADELARTIDRRFWMAERGTYGYLVLPDGRLDSSQEGCGLAFALLFDVAPPKRARLVLRNVHREPFGLTDVWPPFPRFSAERPGRHNDVVWPLVEGLFGRAATKARDADALARTIASVARLTLSTDGRFFEIYNAQTGKPDGGWQNGHEWPSQPDQTWSATAYLSLIDDGLAGLRFEPAGLRFQPLVPKGWGGFSLSGLPYRRAVLNLTVRGEGSRVRRVTMDGKPLPGGLLPGDTAGTHSVRIEMS